MQRAIVRIVEGESTLPAECTPLGICDVELPPFLPKGSPVELTYEYNANQVLEVAVEACGNRASVSIERKTGLSRSRTRSRDGGSGAIERRLRCCSQWSVFRSRCRTTRANGTAGADIIRPIPTSGSVSIRGPIRATSRSKSTFASSLLWWQKKLPLKNQPSNPLAQMLRAGPRRIFALSDRSAGRVAQSRASPAARRRTGRPGRKASGRGVQ